MANEIFDVDCVDSVVRKIFNSYGTINLSDMDIDTYVISSDYEIEKFFFEPNSYKKEINSVVKDVVNKISDEDKREQLYTAVYECILNAYQHGNKRDSNKSVTLAHKINDFYAKVLVMDEGGELEPSFAPFVLRHKQGKHNDGFLDYYNFSGKSKPEENFGTGTSFIHTYVDSVRYFKSSEGGLLVRLRKNL